MDNENEVTMETSESVIADNIAVVDEAAEKVQAPIIKNMAEKIYFDLGGYNVPARFWHKPQPYENRMPHQGKREIARQEKRGLAQTLFVPKPSHPDQPVRDPNVASRQVLRRKARLAEKNPKYNLTD
jgi:hypothetical protein